MVPVSAFRWNKVQAFHLRRFRPPMNLINSEKFPNPRCNCTVWWGGGARKTAHFFRKFSKWPRDQKKRVKSLSSTPKGHLWVQRSNDAKVRQQQLKGYSKFLAKGFSKFPKNLKPFKTHTARKPTSKGVEWCQVHRLLKFFKVCSKQMPLESPFQKAQNGACLSFIAC